LNYPNKKFILNYIIFQKLFYSKITVWVTGIGYGYDYGYDYDYGYGYSYG